MFSPIFCFNQFVLACRKSLSKKPVLPSGNVEVAARDLKKQLKLVREQKYTNDSSVTKVVDL